MQLEIIPSFQVSLEEFSLEAEKPSPTAFAELSHEEKCKLATWAGGYDATTTTEVTSDEFLERDVLDRIDEEFVVWLVERVERRARVRTIGESGAREFYRRWMEARELCEELGHDRRIVMLKASGGDVARDHSKGAPTTYLEVNRGGLICYRGVALRTDDDEQVGRTWYSLTNPCKRNAYDTANFQQMKNFRALGHLGRLSNKRKEQG